jgi:hypothetical protein
MLQHNESRHISSMLNRARFHRKKIASARLTNVVGQEAMLSIASDDPKCNGKDTSRHKLLRCIVRFRQNVTYFAARLSNAMGN